MKNVWQKITSPFSGESAGLHKLIAVLAVLALLIAIPVTLTLVQSQQDIRQEAAQRNRNNNNYRQSGYDTNSPKESNYANSNNKERIVPTNPPTGAPQPTFAYVTLKPGEPTPVGSVCSGGANNMICRIVPTITSTGTCTGWQCPPTPTSVPPDLLPTLSCNHAGSDSNACIKPWLTPPPGYFDAPGGGTYCDKPGANQSTCISRLTPTPDYSSCDNYRVNQNNCIHETPTPQVDGGGGSGGSGGSGGGSGGGSLPAVCKLLPMLPQCKVTPTTNPGGGTISPTSPATGTGPTRTFALNLILHGIGSGGDVINPSGGNPNPQTVERGVQMQFFDSQNRPAGTATGVVTYDAASGTYKGTVSLPLPAGSYTALVTTDNYIQSTPRGIIQVQ